MSFGREIGKRVGGALYVHRDAIVPISQTAERVRAAEQLAGDTAWNVAKIEKISVSLLQYESFDHDFPALLSATTVNLQSGSIKRTDYRGRHSPYLAPKGATPCADRRPPSTFSRSDRHGRRIRPVSGRNQNRHKSPVER